MKLIISVDEIKVAVSKFMDVNGFDILPEEIYLEYETEGEYDCRKDVFTGMSVDLSKEREPKCL